MVSSDCDIHALNLLMHAYACGTAKSEAWWSWKKWMKCTAMCALTLMPLSFLGTHIKLTWHSQAIEATMLSRWDLQFQSWSAEMPRPKVGPRLFYVFNTGTPSMLFWMILPETERPVGEWSHLWSLLSTRMKQDTIVYICTHVYLPVVTPRHDVACTTATLTVKIKAMDPTVHACLPWLHCLADDCRTPCRTPRGLIAVSSDALNDCRFLTEESLIAGSIDDKSRKWGICTVNLKVFGFCLSCP